MRIEPRIVLAGAVGLTMVGGAFYVAKNQPNNTPTTSIVVTTESESAVSLRNFIPVDDNNEDGTPDWQEALSIPEVDLSDISSSTPFEPTTVTENLAVDLITRLEQAQAYNRLVDSEELVAGITSDLDEYFFDEQYDRQDIIIVSTTEIAAQRAYGSRVAELTFIHTSPAVDKRGIDILNQALLANNPELLTDLDILISDFEGLVADLLITPVPAPLVREHLSLLNVCQAMLMDLKAFRVVFEDAALTLVRYERYYLDAYALYTAVSNLYEKLDDAGIQWSEDDIVSRFIRVEEE